MMGRVYHPVVRIPPAAPVVAIAAIAVTARLLRKRPEPPTPEADDSEVVGMPTTWSHPNLGVTTNIGPGWYVELAPTSRN